MPSVVPPLVQLDRLRDRPPSAGERTNGRWHNLASAFDGIWDTRAAAHDARRASH